MISKSEILIHIILCFFICCGQGPVNGAWEANKSALQGEIDLLSETIQVGAERMESYLPMLRGKRIGMMVNQSSLVNKSHLVDSLLSLDINVTKVYAVEHGFRGKADAGEKVQDDIDEKTGLPIISIYGKSKKPTAEQLQGIDLMIFDLQDVGVRFYTYTSSLHYLMEACAEQGLPLIILDRPNPNGKFVAGNIHSLEKTSFVGMHPVPILHGMTIGEYGKMINGEGWLKDAVQCDLKVISCANYDRNMSYALPVRPSPNLPNHRSVLLYPSLCLFEGTVVSIGRGTAFPFQVFGHPKLSMEGFSFTPSPTFGSKHPKLNGEECRGMDLRKLDMQSISEKGLDLSYLIEVYAQFPDKENFFLKNGFFETLCGNGTLRTWIVAGKSEEEIKALWEPGIVEFKQMRKPYLLY